MRWLCLGLALFILAGCDAIKWPAQRMHGLWRNDFEGSQFCASPATSCGYVPEDQRRTPVVHLTFSGPLPTQFKPKAPGGLYQIEFVGRRTVFKGHYGHMGMSDEEVVVERMIGMKEIERPPKQAAR
jgi:hypothetical protein